MSVRERGPSQRSGRVRERGARPVIRRRGRQIGVLLLAMRAVEPRALPDDDRADWRGAFEARLALAIIDAQLAGEAAGLALGIAVAAEGGAAAADRLAQDLGGDRRDAIEFGPRHPPRPA